MNKKRKKKDSGMTLVEVLVAAAIMAFCLSGLLLAYVNLLSLTDATRAFTLANNAGQELMERIKSNTLENVTNSTLSNATINQILTNSEFNETTAWARIEVNEVSSTLKKVAVSVFFKAHGRAMWPDTDHDGVPDAGEYSPVELVNYVGYYTTGNFTQ